MGELLNRQFQRQILQTLAEAYPGALAIGRTFSESGNSVVVNTYYLHEHELVQAKFLETLDGSVHLGNVKITAKGLDFLQDDGGLSAVLGVVTIKIHEDTIKSLLIKEVEKAKADPGVKAKLIDQIKALPGEAVKVLTVEAVKSGLAQSPNVIAWITQALS